MANSCIPEPAGQTLDPHAELTQAHREAARAAAQLCETIARVFQIDVPDCRRKAIAIGGALERIARAERACDSCAGEDHVFVATYEKMLEQHRLAYIDFEQLSTKLENNPSLRCSDIAPLVADIERHINKAEEAHSAAMLEAALKKAQ